MCEIKMYHLKRPPNTKLQHHLKRLIAHHEIISGSDLARQLNIPPPSINRILSGHTADPRCSTLILLADYFDISIDQLLGREKLF
jgi:transcriptional regulator with XRE-family HTH domain